MGCRVTEINALIAWIVRAFLKSVPLDGWKTMGADSQGQPHPIPVESCQKSYKDWHRASAKPSTTRIHIRYGFSDLPGPPTYPNSMLGTLRPQPPNYNVSATSLSYDS